MNKSSELKEIDPSTMTPPKKMIADVHIEICSTQKFFKVGRKHYRWEKILKAKRHLFSKDEIADRTENGKVNTVKKHDGLWRPYLD